MTIRKKPFINIVGKGENAGNQHFFLFPQCFPPIHREKPSLWQNLFCRLQMLSIWLHLNSVINSLPHYPDFKDFEKEAF